MANLLRREAAVALILDPQKEKLLFIQRANREGDPFKNDFAFPGGMREEEESLKVTAIREVKEELGVDLDSASYLGSFSSDRIMHVKTCIEVYPFVFQLQKTVEFFINIEEVKSCFWNSIEQFPAKGVIDFFELSDQQAACYYLENGGKLWGSSFRLMRCFLENKDQFLR